RRTGVLLPRLPMLVRPLLAVLFRVMFRFSVAGRERLPLAPPFFVVAAHRSYLDPVFVGKALPFVAAFVTTAPSMRSALGGFVLRRLMSIPRQRWTSDPGSLRGIRKALREGFVVGLFPAGERSWSGAAGALKPEVVRLLQHHADVPIVPVRIAGAYHAWPRWRRFPGRTVVRVEFGEPFRLTPDLAPEQALAELASGLAVGEEPEAQDRCVRRAAGLARLVYRCPACRSWWPAGSDRAASLSCARCEATVTLTERLTAMVEAGGAVRELSLASLYEKIRLRAEEWKPGKDSPSLPRVAARVRSEVSDVSVQELEGELQLEADELIASGARGRLLVRLSEIEAAVIEGDSRLLIYEPRSRRLTEVRVATSGALLWQDAIVAVAEARGLPAPRRA
ncbi:MAG: lysophospholipid acyltransferase family protein, partial [Acidobacteriota bacterium]